MAGASALANGLRRNALAMARRWAAWPRGAEHHARLIAILDELRQRAVRDPASADDVVADLRAVLEWLTYQSTSLLAARTVVVARRTRALSHAFGLAPDDAAPLRRLADAEPGLLEHVRERTTYMARIAAQRPHLALPPPLVAPEMLAVPPERAPSRLALIARLRGTLEK